MGLRKNIDYQNESLNHPEPFLDDYVTIDSYEYRIGKYGEKIIF